MPLTNVLKKSRAKGESTQSGNSRWAALGLILSMAACTSSSTAADIIIDNKDPGVSWSYTGWWGQNIISAYKGQTLRTRTKTASSTYKFGSLPNGKYDVYMYWPVWSGELVDNAVPVLIKHSGGQQTVTVNQQQNGGQWNRLGSWTLDNTAYLTLTHWGNGVINSDAVKLVPSLGTPPQDPALSLTANPLTVSTGGAAALSWTSQNTTSCTASAGWSGNKGTSGSESIKKITSSQTYNLTCAGTTKNVSASVNVTVASTPPPVKPVVGLNVQQRSGTFDAAGQAFTTELGAHSLRLAYNHGDYNFGVNWAAQNGMSVLFMLGYGAGCSPYIPEGRQCYADRSAALAQTYGSKVEYYEVWNEWNGGFGLGCIFTQPPCTDVAMYTDLLCRTYRAVKAVQPNAKIVGGVTAGTHTSFISRMLDAGAGNCMDRISVHPYVYFPNLFTVPYNSPGSIGADKFIEAITAVDNLVRQKTGRSIPILVTEEGRGDIGTAPNEQITADYITELYKRARTIPFLEGIWWYELEDVAGPGQAPGNGLLRSNNTKKPAFAAFQAAAKK